MPWAQIDYYRPVSLAFFAGFLSNESLWSSWGLGRTSTPRSGCSRGIPEWASVVDEVLDLLRIDRCGIMAHSAGAPYALSFANRYPERVVGDVCLLAPWVGGGEGGN